ncbi:MAG: hypothetical protein M9887_12570 [Chitinophagales bacterium]|nr:hypothetical protein [Chitinophagales bacterium]
MRIACEILYKYSDENLLFILNEALKNLGFTPNYYSIFYNQFKKPKSDIPYNEKEIIRLFNKSQKLENVKIFEQLYDEDIITDKSKWFQLSLNIESEKEFQETIGNSFLLEWSNFDLDFLLESNFFKNVINDKNLIYCYIYNQDDLMEQSNTIYNQFEEKPSGKKLVKNQYGDIEIDVTENWGRYEKIRSVNFLAGSKMYFGQGFNPICNIKTMQKFKYSKPQINSILIEIYPIDKNPNQYREIQKDYWKFINESKIKYDKANQLDFTKWIISKSKNK